LSDLTLLDGLGGADEGENAAVVVAVGLSVEQGAAGDALCGLDELDKHHGEHKRMGATDVIPFVPQMDVTVEEAVEMSKRVAQRIWDELKVPSFLYEDSATRPERRNLATCRKGEFEGMPEKLLQPEWAPDYGERKIHPTAGITAIGARMPLVAVQLQPRDQ